MTASPAKPTACLALADGTIFMGQGFGATGEVVAELVFNTAMTGYQEIMTDPSYASQIVTFTFPHIGNTGVTEQDDEAADPVASGIVVKWDPTEPSNWRATSDLQDWMRRRGRIGMGGVDSRRLTRAIRQQGSPHVVLAHDPDGKFDIEAMIARARDWKGLVGLDLAREVTTRQSYHWEGGLWSWPGEFAPQSEPQPFKVVALDYGAKRNILRSLVSVGADVTVLPATATAEDVLAHAPEGVFLSNGPGDPEATGEYAVPMIKALLESDVPIFGICLGHQMLALALGAKTVKMGHGHHGANHPVRDIDSGKVEITSMNHGFAVDAQTLPEGVRETHISLFDGSNCGIEIAGRPVFSVQYHPEAAPGPQDSAYLFERFADSMRARRSV
ncbi:MAG TPA: glutamine-hydrolyzing carbamoyl-phosphate synthase small subunit [Paracoccus sp. (in: a-proteobacteria)]|uniref:glutamine-hydrolyzing carbamoyl-phosphate synthase small subunit n=1 Tax=uncultured Paracoccus sp. TaxID=189685 RepID=UPI002631E6F8|nr:glutamine-hydrolyzing carbamoyl-phosphate synthase small subunit [uncultured Paracoccus sp.]HMQ42218.1 glutamine-hydrolyzing carbamoyl-phosphate synthase small subunit [Paracoccus sp. (in: a-proteobacteria)]HMR37261.1 glutamine-hydrolyzing carbamoyl-phosphate synthase small subunit [Paracoccus sp. (in: a-proteobacteria)]